MDENPYKPTDGDGSTGPGRRWPWAVVLAITGPLLGLAALRLYQAVSYYAGQETIVGQETINRGVVLTIALTVIVAWSAYKMVRP